MCSQKSSNRSANLIATLSNFQYVFDYVNVLVTFFSVIVLFDSILYSFRFQDMLQTWQWNLQSLQYFRVFKGSRFKLLQVLTYLPLNLINQVKGDFGL